MSPPPGMCRDEVRAVNQSTRGFYAHTGVVALADRRGFCADTCPDVRSTLPAMPTELLAWRRKMDCSATGATQWIDIRPHGPMLDQSVFCPRASGAAEALRQAAVRKKPSRPTHFETLILRPA